VIALAGTAEALEIDSKNLSFSKLASYPTLLKDRCTRLRYNSRRRRLHNLIKTCLRSLSEWIEDPTEALLTDSMPIPTASVKRESRSRACRRADVEAQVADKVYHASSGSFFVGFKIHLITTVSAVYVDHVLRPASEHDANVLAELAEAAADKVLPKDLWRRIERRLVLADKGYVGKQHGLDFGDQFGGLLKTVCRSNAKE